MTIIDINNMETVSKQEKLLNRIDNNYNVYRYEGELYIVKPRKRDKYTDFNEFFCQYITPIFNLENALYVYIKNGDDYLLATKNFKKIEYIYYRLSELLLRDKCFTALFGHIKSTEKIKAMRQFFSNTEKYQAFMDQLISFFAFDYYSNQIDRASSNIMFVGQTDKPFTDFMMTPIYDNERSFDYNNFLRIRNDLYNGNLHDDAFLDLLDEHPNGLAAFRKILDINIEEHLSTFENDDCAYLLNEPKKDHIKKIDEDAKRFVLKYLGK